MAAKPPADAQIFPNAVISRGNLNRLQPVRIIEAHDDAVRDVVFSTDGQYVVSAGDYLDNNVRVWDVSTGALVAEHHDHLFGVFALAYHPRRNLVVSGGGDGVVRLWDVISAQTLMMFEGHTGAVLDVTFNPDATLLASSGADGTVQLWDVQRGTHLQVIQHHEEPAQQLVFTADGEQLVILYRDEIVIRRVTSGQIMRVLDVELLGLASAVTIDSVHGLVLSDGESVRWWDVTSFDETHPPIAVTNIDDLAFGHSGDVLVGAKLNDRMVPVWDTLTGEQLMSLPGHALGVYSVAMHPDGTTLAVGAGDGRLHLWAVGHQAICRVIARETANLRTGPGAEYAVEDVLRGDVGASAHSRSMDAADFIWWQIERDLWIREDAVFAQGQCDDLPVQ